MVNGYGGCILLVSSTGIIMAKARKVGKIAGGLTLDGEGPR